MKISSRRIVSRACRNFFRVVFFLAEFFPLVVVVIVIVVGDGECCCCCCWWYGSITWMCVCMCVVDLCIGWLVHLFCVPHSGVIEISGTECNFDGAKWCVCDGSVDGMFRWSHHSYRWSKIPYRIVFHSFSLSLCLTHTPLHSQHHHIGKCIHIEIFPKMQTVTPYRQNHTEYTLENGCENGKYASQTKRNSVV